MAPSTIEATDADYEEHSDNSLLGFALAGDERAATAIYDRHSAKLLTIARARLSTFLSSRVDPEDIVQSTFKSFFRRAVSKGFTAPESGELLQLLAVIALRKVNAKASYHLAEMRDVRKSVEPNSWIPPTDDQRPLHELLLTIEECCQGMSALQRQMIEMRLEDYSVGEIAKRLQRSKRTVERELQRFRDGLAQHLAAM